MKNLKLTLSLFLLCLLFATCKKEKQAANTVKDIDGNVYKTITIGTQTWMAENLKTTKFNDGTLITNVTADASWQNAVTPAYCWLDHDLINKPLYGALYNAYAVQSGKLAPAGWHIPTNADWVALENYLIANGYNWDGTLTGNKTGKALAAITGWDIDTTPGNVGNDPASNNKSGFNGIYGFRRNPSGGFLIGAAWWWSSTAAPNNSSLVFYLTSSESSPFHTTFPNNYGFSVRCIKD